MLTLKSASGRWVLAATVLGSSVASLDSTVVNVALPTIGRDLGAGITELSWVVTGYLITLAGLLLLGGALSDRFGRRRVFVLGVVWFTVASVLCGLATSATVLTLARALQGVGGALLTPGSLAIIEASFEEEDRAAAIGAWSGLGGVAIAIGPLLGGAVVQAVSWRVIFFLNVPIAAAVVLIALRHVPETKNPDAPQRLDVAGAILGAVGLGGVTYALIDGAAAAGIAGLVALAAFFVVEKRHPAPMLDLALFRSRQFSGANAATLLVYAALGGAMFLLPIELQQVAGYTPLASGLALLPTTIMMLLLSPTMGRLSTTTIGPQMPMSVGPCIAAAGIFLLARAGHGPFATHVLPAMVVFGLGLAVTVAPLTATVLAAVPPGHEGMASAINNCLARTGSLIAVAVLPAAAGLAGAQHLSDAGFGRGMVICAAVCAAGGLVALMTIRRR